MDGGIFEVGYYDEKDKRYISVTDDDWYPIYPSQIAKHSKNLIDLIEAGDILEIKDSLYDTKYTSEVFESYEGDLCINNFEVSEIIPIRKFIDENQIEIISILTHEQFEQIKYKVKEN